MTANLRVDRAHIHAHAHTLIEPLRHACNCSFDNYISLYVAQTGCGKGQRGVTREERILLAAYRRARTLNGPQIIITKRFYYRVKLITRPATPPFAQFMLMDSFYSVFFRPLVPFLVVVFFLYIHFICLTFSSIIFYL